MLLRTHRLQLRPFRADDLAMFLSFAQADEYRRFLGEEIACLLDPSVHGMGIATEAARVVIADGFERRRYDEIVARAHADNLASLRAMARLGFGACDDGTYRLRRSDWQAQR